MEGESTQSMKMARLNSGTEIDTVLWRWFCTACEVDPPILQQSKDLSIAKAFEADHNFKASNDWLEKWKKKQCQILCFLWRDWKCRH